MATVNLTIPITDAEQAVIQVIKDELGVTMTPIETKEWLERRGKALLREYLQGILRRHREEVEWAASASVEQEVESGWPVTTEPIGP